MPKIRLASGAVATVRFGRWTCPRAPRWADYMNTLGFDGLARKTGHLLDYVPDQDQALAIWATEFCTGSRLIRSNRPPQLPPWAVA